MKLNAQEFYACVRELKKEVPVTMSQIMAWAMAHWCKRLINKTGGDPRLALGGQKKLGEKAVTVDVNRLFKDLDDYSWWNPKNKGDVVGMRSHKSNAVFFIPKNRWLGTVGASLEPLHNKSRNTKGRITRETAKNPYYTWASMIIDLGKTKLQHVGKTKSAWLKAMNYFAAKAGGLFTQNIPSWITRHKSWGDKYSVSNMQIQASEASGLMQAGVNVPWISEHDNTSALEATKRITLKDLQSGHALMRLNKVFQKHSARAA